MTENLFVIHPADNVGVTLVPRGEVPAGHKIALRDIAAGEAVVKYGWPIGTASREIRAGEWVHVHNLKSSLEGIEEFEWEEGESACGGTAASADAPSGAPAEAQAPVPALDLRGRIFRGFRRDGEGSGAAPGSVVGTPTSVGVRNEVWIIPTVGCVNDISREISARSAGFVGGSLGRIVGFTHPYGCSQLGGDQAMTLSALCGLIRHPNAAGVLVLGLGCENANIAELKKVLGPYDPERVKFLICQEAGDEIAEGVELVRGLAERAKRFRREDCPVSELAVGLKCGGSDGLSGITANPLLGRFADALCRAGGRALLTEVPEMFGAERLLLRRSADREVFGRAKELMQGFRRYYLDHGEPIGENPSPGNLAGGISTLEEKSLGCVQKGGCTPVTGVYGYGERAAKPGLGLVWGPGNDLVSTSALCFAGTQLVLFSTGRGTPFGCPVPTAKIATNAELAARKSAWIDFDASKVLEAATVDGLSSAAAAGSVSAAAARLSSAAELDAAFADYVLRVASGEETRSERFARSELAIFKDGVIL